MPTREEELYQERVAKLNRLRERGIDPYPPRFNRTHSSTATTAAFEAWEPDARDEAPVVTVAGRVTAMRSMGKVSFVDLRDGEGRIQLFLRPASLDEKSQLVLTESDLGDFLGATGKLFRTRAGEISVEVESLTMLSKALQTPPEKWHGLTDVEQRYRQRYRDLIANEDTRKLFILRSKVVSTMRRFLDDRGFIEVETPILGDHTGGAAARPFVTHHNTLDREMYLRIATELHLKRLIVGGYDKVYEIGRVFRNEGVSWKHNPEFTTLESYEAYADYNMVMAMVEEMTAHIAEVATGSTVVQFEEHEVEFRAPWRRLTLRQSLIEYAGIDIEVLDTTEKLRAAMIERNIEIEAGAGWGKLVDIALKAKVEPALIQPTFIVDYPTEHSPLAKRKPDNEHYVERFEPIAGGLKFGNAYSELNDPLEQRERFETQLKLKAAGDDEAELADDDFLIALEHGMPPTGGLGIGIDRLVMLLSGKRSIREVILFPTLRERH